MYSAWPELPDLLNRGNHPEKFRDVVAALALAGEWQPRDLRHIPLDVLRHEREKARAVAFHKDVVHLTDELDVGLFVLDLLHDCQLGQYWQGRD